jgi:hypothetical protein
VGAKEVPEISRAGRRLLAPRNLNCGKGGNTFSRQRKQREPNLSFESELARIELHKKDVQWKEVVVKYEGYKKNVIIIIL